jgi:hypothetical protein
MSPAQPYIDRVILSRREVYHRQFQLSVPPPGRIVGGSILFNGRDLLQLPQAEMRSVRGRDISFVFQGSDDEPQSRPHHR